MAYCTDPPKVGPRNPTFGGLLMAKYSYDFKEENRRRILEWKRTS